MQSSKNTITMGHVVFIMTLDSSKRNTIMTSGKTIRYEKNPFIENMIIPIKGQKVRLSPLGQEENILINQVTGEVHGTHITTYRKVDSAQFVKIFTANIALTFNLNTSGIKAFNVLLWALQNKALGKDILTLDSLLLEEFLIAHTIDLKLSLATFKRGLSQLEKGQIIAKALRKGWYYINPNFCFNGDRVAFTTLIERSEKEVKDVQTNLDLIN